jgi:hypothetical protein
VRTSAPGRPQEFRASAKLVKAMSFRVTFILRKDGHPLLGVKPPVWS